MKFRYHGKEFSSDQALEFAAHRVRTDAFVNTLGKKFYESWIGQMETAAGAADLWGLGLNFDEIVCLLILQYVTVNPYRGCGGL